MITRMISHVKNSAKRDLVFLIALALGIAAVCLSMCSCRSEQSLLSAAEVRTRDTLVVHDVRLDSVYVFRDRQTEYHLNPLNPLRPSETDTVFVKDRSVEYRYRLLHDTIRIVHRDSVPYPVTVREVKEVERPPNWFDRCAHFAFWLDIGILLVWLLRLFRKLR